MTNTTTVSDLLTDAAVATADITVLAAAVDELADRIQAGRLDGLAAYDISRDALPRLRALEAYFVDLLGIAHTVPDAA